MSTRSDAYVKVEQAASVVSSGSTPENVLSGDVTVLENTSYVVVGYLDLNGFDLILEGNLEIL